MKAIKNKSIIIFSILTYPIILFCFNFIEKNIGHVESKTFLMSVFCTLSIIFLKLKAFKETKDFFKKSYYELRFITWADKKETLKLMFNVILILLFSLIFISIIDGYFTKAIEYLLF